MGQEASTESRGFGWFLSQQYEENAVIQNEGRSGYTSTDIREDFTNIIKQSTSPNHPPVLLFTIFLGANDAFLPIPPVDDSDEGCVPLATFSANIRSFVDTFLSQKANAMAETKILLITPPPANINRPFDIGVSRKDFEMLNEEEKRGHSYKTFVSKKRYAEEIMRIAKEYGESGRVVGLDFWGDLIRTGFRVRREEYDENRLPGCGLYGVDEFGEGYFTDGLHLDAKGYDVLSQGVYNKVVYTWPELAPEALSVPQSRSAA
ncbi:hypothetical protein B5807_09285 [Epicoccum nigrum]|uniref:Uncharacterized protein n=1 Tax=Epicoccum nigrum TaxID=105696 RepID=A0A1Y2LN09_EPING|nr:hypothetical protein B5807_09285 [Epicoccum nigrum]